MTNSRELDLRDEVLAFFDGRDFGNEKFHVLLQRQIRIDDTKYPYINRIRCKTCNHDYSNEGRVGCPDCDGIGYLWDEKLIVGYAYRPQQIRLADQYAADVNLGRKHNAASILITPYKYKVNVGDILYVIDADENGGIIVPIIKKTKYLCVAPAQARLDFNKIEFNTSVITEVQ